jgi:nicotinate-nucleotide adenylyltransferase
MKQSLIPRFGHRYRIKIGLLGGSFNPAHVGHLHVARAAMIHGRLNQLWLMVSPGNPLKPAAGMAPLAQRLASARHIADGRYIIATDIERHLHTTYTAKTLAALRKKFPRAEFVWLMGADNLSQLPKWKSWLQIAHTVPMLIIPRPGETRRALAGQAVTRLRRHRLPGRSGLKLAGAEAPAWILLPGRENPASATALRQIAVQVSEGATP